MKHILLLGAGRSASSLISYLLDQASTYDWMLHVADLSLDLAQAKVGSYSRGKAQALDITNPEARATAISEADVVISLLPPALHQLVAEDCLRLSKHLGTASYVAPELRAMEFDIRHKGLIFLCELGLDPGIDHMTAMQLIHATQAKGCKIKSFKSYTGGLIAPESDNNPWHYKFTWNPRNVVLAGQGLPVQYIHDKSTKYIPYHRLFAETQAIEILGWGPLEAYPNRNSVYYQDLYQLQEADTVLRATLRYPGFSRAWNIFVQLGMTDDSYKIDPSNLSYAAWLRGYLPESVDAMANTEEAFAKAFQLKKDDPILEQFRFLGLFSNEPIGLHALKSPAELLQRRLEQFWGLSPEDKDMIIMQHELIYEDQAGDFYKHLSSLVAYGKDMQNTAMSYLVGLPLAIGIKNLLLGKITQTGIHIPTEPSIYEPILEELHDLRAIAFQEKVLPIN